jgi:hypothetical protein
MAGCIGIEATLPSQSLQANAGIPLKQVITNYFQNLPNSS